MNKKDLRQKLVLLTDEFIKIRELPVWEEVATTSPELQARLSEAINSSDALWFLWRSLTVKND